MLVLTRRLGEEIIIAGKISVSVIAIDGAKVRLGISAPDSVAVDRREVHERRLAFAAQEPGKPVLQEQHQRPPNSCLD
jgi:carbon storage regulator